MVKYCNFAGIGMIAYFALGAGKLARPLGSDTTARSQGMSRAMPWFANPEKSENEIRRRVEKVAKDKGWTMTQVSLAWLNARVTSPLVGVTTVSAQPLVRRLLTQRSSRVRWNAWTRPSSQASRSRRTRASISRSRECSYTVGCRHLLSPIFLSYVPLAVRMVL
jgi:diketogulonate reductase-like aldo/keto reductase